MMRLVIGCEWVADRPGGLNRYASDLTGALRSRGDHVRLLVLGPGGAEHPDFVVATGDRAWPMIPRVAAMWFASLRHLRCAAIVDVHFALYGLAAALMTRRPRRLVVHFHGPWATESVVAGSSSSFGIRVKRLLERLVYRRADLVITLSAAFRQIVIDTYGVEPSRVVVIPPGVDLDRFRPGSRAQARARWGVAPEDFVTVAARRLDPRMGLDTLLRAWVQLTLTPGVRLLIAGTGSQAASLSALARDLRIEDTVRLLGRISDSDLVELYRAADCAVVPSRSLEGFGLTTLEALACGTPVVVTEVGGLPEAVQGLDSSLVVPADNAPALGRRLQTMRTAPSPSAGLCIAHARAHSWESALAAEAMAMDLLGPPRLQPSRDRTRCHFGSES